MNNEWPTDFAEFCRQCVALGASVDYRVRGDELRRIDNRPRTAGASACGHCGASDAPHETADGILCSDCLSACMDM